MSEANPRVGPYEVLGTIGRGGMAEVLLARLLGADGFERDVVIKRVLPALADDREFIDMFRDEARITAQLRHGNIVQVLELRQDDGLYGLVLEYVDGPSLDAVVKAARRAGRTIPYTVVAYILSEVARALDYAHRKRGADGTPLGIIHRDVSPSNVLVSRDGEVKLADFGIARATSRISSTRAGGIKGKLSYIAPEAMLGEATSRSDLFSLGVMGWELLTGKLPFDADTDEARMFRVLSVDAADVREIVPDAPLALAEMVMRLVTKDESGRPSRAAEVVDALGRLALDAGDARTAAEMLAELVLATPKSTLVAPPAPTRAGSRVASRVITKPSAVLVVEASATARGLLRVALGSSVTIVEVSDQKGALEAARTHRLTLVLSQQLLPDGGSGTELCRQLRALPEHAATTFALIVFEDSPEVTQRAREAGVSHIISKSDPAKLIALVRSLVANVA